MTDKLRFSQPKTPTTSDLLDAAVKTVEQQLAAKSPASEMWGFNSNGDYVAWADLDYPHDCEEFPNCRFEIRHLPLKFKGPRWARRSWCCTIMVTDGSAYHLAAGLIFDDKYHSLCAWDGGGPREDGVEEFPELQEAEAQPRCNQLH